MIETAENTKIDGGKAASDKVDYKSTDVSVFLSVIAAQIKAEKIAPAISQYHLVDSEFAKDVYVAKERYDLFLNGLKRTVFENLNYIRASYISMISSNIDGYFQKDPVYIPLTTTIGYERTTPGKEFTSRILSKPDLDESLDALMDEFSSLLFAERFQTCDEILKGIVLSRFTVEHLLGVLTITLSFKEHLNERDSFYYQVYSMLSDNLGIKKATELLRGLD